MANLSQSTETVQMTELEQRLCEPQGEFLRQELLMRLENLEHQFSQHLAASVPRAEFKLVSDLVNALRCAQEVLQRWPLPPNSTADSTFRRLNSGPVSDLQFLTSGVRDDFKF